MTSIDCTIPKKMVLSMNDQTLIIRIPDAEAFLQGLAAEICNEDKGKCVKVSM